MIKNAQSRGNAVTDFLLGKTEMLATSHREPQGASRGCPLSRDSITNDNVVCHWKKAIACDSIHRDQVLPSNDLLVEYPDGGAVDMQLRGPGPPRACSWEPKVPIAKRRQSLHWSRHRLTFPAARGRDRNDAARNFVGRVSVSPTCPGHSLPVARPTNHVCCPLALDLVHPRASSWGSRGDQHWSRTQDDTITDPKTHNVNGRKGSHA